MSVLTVTVYRSRWRREWRWRATASNGRKMANSGEGYRRWADCFNAMMLVLSDADVRYVESGQSTQVRKGVV